MKIVQDVLVKVKRTLSIILINKINQREWSHACSHAEIFEGHEKLRINRIISVQNLLLILYYFLFTKFYKIRGCITFIVKLIKNV